MNTDDARWLAWHLLGWRPCDPKGPLKDTLKDKWWTQSTGYAGLADAPRESWEFAGRVLEALHARNIEGEIHFGPEPWCRIWVRGTDDEWHAAGSTPPEAICAAARKAIEATHGSQVREDEEES